MLKDMTPEDQLCLVLARRLSPSTREQALELLSFPVSWPLLLERARGYGITPVICQNLQALDFRNVPQQARSELTNFYKVNAIRNELLGSELARILGLLGKAGIPAMPLKGIALAESLYDEPAMRFCEDIDVLVPKERIIEAVHIIAAAGYKPDFEEPFLLDLLVRYGKDCFLMRETPMCTYPIELHCGLLWGGELERGLLKRIWSDAIRKTVYKAEAFALSAEWEFLYLAIHAARHGQLALKWLIDLDRFCSRSTLDWQSIEQKAIELGWKGAIQESLSQCAYFLGTTIEPAFASTKSARQTRHPDPDGVEVPGGMFFSLRLLKTPSQKLRFIAIRLFVPTSGDCRFLPLPSSLTFLYYVLRPFRVIAISTGWLVRAALRKIGRLVAKTFSN
jgi:hypothetical protein